VRNVSPKSELLVGSTPAAAVTSILEQSREYLFDIRNAGYQLHRHARHAYKLPPQQSLKIV
jgi:hypothetical protein